MEEVRVPWNAWYGDEEMVLTFPPEWKVMVRPMRGAPDIGDEAIKEAFRSPIGTGTIREIARGRRDAVIAVDDITRPTPASRILPHIIKELMEAGISQERIKIIIALGIHRPHQRQDNLKKLGKHVVDNIEIMNHVCSCGKLAYIGTTSCNTPVHINQFFVEADVKIGVGSIVPHSSAGFAGGGKIVLPGLAGIDTIDANHRPAEAGETGGIGLIEGNLFRQEVEEAAKMAGLEFIANVVVNSRRGIAGIFVGDQVLAHREGVKMARRVYATPDVPEEMDIVVINSYPKDQNLGQQAINAFDILLSTTKNVVRKGGVIILSGACLDGLGSDKCSDRFLKTHDYIDYREAMEDRQMVVFSPNASLPDVRCAFPEDTLLFTDWKELILALGKDHGPETRVAVFPCASIQIKEN